MIACALNIEPNTDRGLSHSNATLQPTLPYACTQLSRRASDTLLHINFSGHRILRTKTHPSRANGINCSIRVRQTEDCRLRWEWLSREQNLQSSCCKELGCHFNQVSMAWK